MWLDFINSRCPDFLKEAPKWGIRRATATGFSGAALTCHVARRVTGSLMRAKVVASLGSGFQ